MENQVAATVLGVAGAVCWSSQLIPQIIVNYRRHHARGLQSSMMLLWAFAGIPLGVYTIAQNLNVALQVQPQLLTFLSLVTWGQCLYYKKSWSLTKVTYVLVGMGTFLAALEVALIFALKEAHKRNLTWPFTLMAVISALLLAMGVGRHYIDIYQKRTVRGISFLFVAIDALGDLFSLLSLVFHIPFDILASVIYGTELVMWIGIMICGVVLGRGEKEQPIADGNEMELPTRAESLRPRSGSRSASGSGVQTTAVTSRLSDTSSIRSRSSRHSVFYTASLRPELER